MCILLILTTPADHTLDRQNPLIPKSRHWSLHRDTFITISTTLSNFLFIFFLIHFVVPSCEVQICLYRPHIIMVTVSSLAQCSFIFFFLVPIIQPECDPCFFQRIIDLFVISLCNIGHMIKDPVCTGKLFFIFFHLASHCIGKLCHKILCRFSPKCSLRIIIPQKSDDRFQQKLCCQILLQSGIISSKNTLPVLLIPFFATCRLQQQK